jgi:polysaccharide export outer membrane protein
MGRERHWSRLLIFGLSLVITMWSTLITVRAEEGTSEQHPLLTKPAETLGTPNDYRIGAEDVVEISVWKSPDLSATVSVRPDGMISMPLLGDILAQGKTPTELQQTIAERLKAYKQDPNVSVIIQQINSPAFFILGEIVHPGKYPLKSETTVLQALALAGGFTQWAEKDKLLLFRKSSQKGDRSERISIRYKDLLVGKVSDSTVTLQPGDTIVVP